MSNDKSDDVEALLYPSMQESPGLRWAFIRKVYTILAVQILTTIAVAAAVASHPPVAIFFGTTWGGWGAYILILITSIIVIFLLAAYQHKHPINFLLLGVYTLCFGLVVGLAASFVSGIVIIEAASATLAVVVSLTLYTFWAARRGEDFRYLAPFTLTVVVTIVLFIIFQIFFPMGKISEMLYSGLVVLLLSIYIIFYTNTLIKSYSYDQYIWASVTLYVGILNIFVRLLQIFKLFSRR